MKPAAAPTHMVSALRTFAFPGPSIKLPPADTLVMGSKIAVAREDGSFAVTRDGHYLPKAHLAPLGHCEPDFVAVAERFVGTPYLWGGKTSLGVDCSGLIQLSLAASGVSAPRDSDMQARDLGEPVELAADLSGLRRGDLIGWKGHIGVMLAAERLLHANGHAMATAIEPLRVAEERIRTKSYGPITAVRRVAA